MFLPVTGEVKVVTYNVRQDTNGDRGERDWKRRSPRVVEFLKKGSFSIIGLQEAKHNQVEDVKRGLPKFVQIGVGRDDGDKEDGENEMGTERGSHLESNARFLSRIYYID